VNPGPVSPPAIEGSSKDPAKIDVVGQPEGIGYVPGEGAVITPGDGRPSVVENRNTNRGTFHTIDLGVQGLTGLANENVAINMSGNGNLGGDAITVQVINGGEQPVKIVGEGVVLEPVENQQAIQENQSQWADAVARAQEQGMSVATSKFNAYCLEILGLPPAVNTLFQIAGPELQQQFLPVKTILQAARTLHEEGALSYDDGQSDKEEYRHSITQWATWVRIEDLDRQQFEDRFTEQTQKNFEAADVDFTPEAEAFVRDNLSQSRWSDIQNINELANRIKGQETTSLDRAPEHARLFADPPREERFAVRVARFNGIRGG
jgi:hypothetical protein